MYKKYIIMTHTLKFSLIMAAGLLLSCKEIPITISDPFIPESDRVVLIEELTGASCSNCPKGSATIDNILSRHEGKVVAIGVHGKFLSYPTPKSKYDFRNQKAKELEAWFTGWQGKPSASVNRSVDPSSGLIVQDNPDLWLSGVERELQKPHVMNILLDTKYNTDTRQVDLEIAVIPLTDLPGNYNISIYLTESGIVDAQADGTVIIENFTFKHVLMDMMTKHSGDVLATDLEKNKVIKKNYSYTLPSNVPGLWNAQNMEVIVMVSRSSPTDVSVLQAASVHVIK